MKCTLIIGCKSKWDFREPDVEKFRGSFTNTHLVFKSVKDAKLVARIAGLDCYRVMKIKSSDCYVSHSDKPLYETADITAFWKRSKMDAEEHDKEMNRKVVAINKLPKLFDVKELELDNGSKLYVYLNRSDYTYNRSRSSSLSGYVSFMVKRDGRVVSDTWWPSDYIKRDGKVQVKKFKEDFYWKFGTHTEEMPKNFNYKEFILRMRREQVQLEKKIREI